MFQHICLEPVVLISFLSPGLCELCEPTGVSGCQLHIQYEAATQRGFFDKWCLLMAPVLESMERNFDLLGTQLSEGLNLQVSVIFKKGQQDKEGLYIPI